jgi:hypothetical protein
LRFSSRQGLTRQALGLLDLVVHETDQLVEGMVAPRAQRPREPIRPERLLVERERARPGLDLSAQALDAGPRERCFASPGRTLGIAHSRGGPRRWRRIPDLSQATFRSSGDVETSATRVSNNVDLLAEAIVLNYLALHDEVDQLDQVLPGHGLGTATEIDSLVALQPIRASS